jgi:two-component system sensor histidine kinase KdpD
MEEGRPSPDLLLEQVQEEEQRKKEGKLKIFFGAAPGVGKTYAMLAAARQKRADGLEVVAGLVETHGRAETEALLEGLEIRPRREIEYRGTLLKEFDLDAALGRKPEIILVDELAHTNVSGSRHKKRWQDVFELLSAGINVYTTLNVQHLESLNDVVSQISGITVRETLPDSVLDRADEIELIDLPPDELLQRLREGKVYVPELAQRAKEHFFRPGNLLALREIALRRTAERVDAQMRRYRTIQGITAVWPAAERIMVCVGANPRSIQLLRTAKRMATGLRAEWIAVYVEAPSTVKPTKEDLRRLREHLRLAESLGAETATLSGHKASEELLRYARVLNVTKMIIGKPTHPRWKDKLFGSLLDEVVRGSGEIDIYVMTGDSGDPLPHMTARPERPRGETKEWALSLGIVLGSSLVAELMHYYFTLVDLAMVYLLGIVLVAWRTSRWPSLAATFLSVMAYDFLFVPPRFTFSVSDARYFFTFVVMILVALVISRLTLRIREQAHAARQRERQTSALYSLIRELVHEQGIPSLSAKAIKHLSKVLSCKVTILVPDEKGRLAVPVTGPETFALDPRELGVAQWTFDHRQQAGFGTDTLPGATALYLPLATSTRTVGVLGILPGTTGRLLDQEQAHLLESFANQIAMAFERALLADEARQALMKAETETLRNTLLSSVSHDLRTPLAAITGAATALLQTDLVLDQPGRQELVHTIHEEANRLNEIIRNLLDMTRLESKTIRVKKDWQSLEEIVGVVLNRLSERLKDRDLRVSIPADLPLVPFDPLLIEQVIMNLLDNAIKYTPADTPLKLKAGIREKALLLELADRGPGIPAGTEEKIFEKFVRGSGATGGIGLGLTICRAIVKAHGGHTWAENRPGGGAVFRFTLPLEEEPPRPEPEGIPGEETHG